MRVRQVRSWRRGKKLGKRIGRWLVLPPLTSSITLVNLLRSPPGRCCGGLPRDLLYPGTHEALRCPCSSGLVLCLRAGGRRAACCGSPLGSDGQAGGPGHGAGDGRHLVRCACTVALEPAPTPIARLTRLQMQHRRVPPTTSAVPLAPPPTASLPPEPTLSPHLWRSHCSRFQVGRQGLPGFRRARHRQERAVEVLWRHLRPRPRHRPLLRRPEQPAQHP